MPSYGRTTPIQSPQTPSRAVGQRARSVSGLFLVLIGFNFAAWIWAFAISQGRPALLGTALLAWVFGLRHAVDADHIAAIDNAVRKLMQQGERPVTTGLFFSLGHSTVVFAAVALLAATAAALKDDLATFKSYSGAIGVSISAIFLLLIAVLNLFILRSVWHSFRNVAHDGALEQGTRVTPAASSAASSARCFASSRRVGTCIRSVSCSALASIPRPRSDF